MRQAVWTGTINFGLVSIPVRLYPATEPKDVRFHLYDRRTGRRVRYERVTREYEAPTFEPAPEERDTPFRTPDTFRTTADAPFRARDEDDDQLERDDVDVPGPEYVAPPSTFEVEADDIVRGVELPTGDFVTVSDEEIESLTPERSRTIDIEEFVDLAEIDPIFFEKSYYVAPTRNTGADKPYVLLLRAMQAANMVGIGRFVLRTKPHLVAIRPLENALSLETLFFGDEVRSAEEIARLPKVDVNERELKMAKQLITALSTEWIPEKHADTYREELLELLRSKPATQRAEEPAVASAPVDDLMAALKASVEAAKRKGEVARAPRKKRTG